MRKSNDLQFHSAGRCMATGHTYSTEIASEDMIDSIGSQFELTGTPSPTLLPRFKVPFCAVPKLAQAVFPIGNAAMALLVIGVPGKFWARAT